MKKDNMNKLARSLVQMGTWTDNIQFSLSLLRDAAADHDQGQYEKHLLNAVEYAERLVLNLRTHAYNTVMSQLMVRHLKEKTANQIYGIKISLSDRILHISLPIACPHCRGSAQPNPLVDPLITALKQYDKDNGLPIYQNAVLAFQNVVEKDTPARLVRDNDNSEFRKIANVLAVYLLPDDDSASCSFFYDTVFSAISRIPSHTEIFVIPQNQFPQWCAEHKTQQKELLKKTG